MSDTIRLTLFIAVAYTASYFWKTPLFVLPIHDDVTVYGIRPRSLFAIVQTIGFGVSKPFAANYVSKTSPENRGKLLAALLTLSSVTLGVGIPMFRGSVKLQAMCVFLAALPSSWLYGLLLAFMEGRSKTDVVTAIVFAFVVVAGGLSRATAQAVYDSSGLSPEGVVSLLAITSLPVALLSTWALGRVPGPSDHEQEQQGDRTTRTTWKDQLTFVNKYRFGLCSLVMFYAALSGFRAFRDFFASDLFGVDGGSSSSIAYLVVDLPGAFLSAALIASLAIVRDNRLAVLLMYSIMLAALVITLAVTLLFHSEIISRKMWLSGIGIGTYLAYAPVCTSLYDRLSAASCENLSCAFLLFYSDLFGYIGSVAFLGIYSAYPEVGIVTFFSTATVVFSLISTVLLGSSMSYFYFRLETPNKAVFEPLALDEINLHDNDDESSL